MEMKRAMDPEVALVLAPKNVCLWEAMLKSVQYPDLGVADEFKQGSELVGCVDRTGLWPMKFQPAAISVSELHEIAKKERGLLRQQFHAEGDPDLTEEVGRKTMEEVGSGCLVVPLKLDDIPSEFPLSRRFGIRQGGKVRCIDDFSRSSVNASVQSTESPKPQTLDVFAALCVFVMSCRVDAEDWRGRTFDLVGAYRQCAIRPSSPAYSHIVVKQPGTDEIVAFRMRALPFGSIRSVHSFLRVASSLWYILVKEFMVLATNYFDDFITLATAPEASAVTSCVQMFFRLLGWAFAETGPKAPEFGEVFLALGVQINVERLSAGSVSICNTASRCEELIVALTKILETGNLGKQEALRLQGRLQFACGQLFGRVAKTALGVVTNHAYGGNSSRLNNKAILALTLHRHLLSRGRPRELKVSCDYSWYIQTDACYEPCEGGIFSGIGAVLFNPAGQKVSFISQRLGDEMLERLNPSGKKTAIYESEFFALFCAFLIWLPRLPNSVVIYTDNNAVRDTLISCCSSGGIAKKILVATLALECEGQLTPWYARVPTDSNCADAPSRLVTDDLMRLGVHQAALDIEDCWERLLLLEAKWGEEQAASTTPV
jgi:hypothetical protein